MRYLRNLRRRFIVFLGGWRVRGRKEEAPLRAELYSLQQLERYAVFLARSREGNVSEGYGRDKLLPRLEDNRKLLEHIHKLITDSVSENRKISPAAEWLLDNFYLIEDQIRTIREHFPRSYSRELPRLTKGPFSGFPRVYEIAFNIISHNDGKVDREILESFIDSYQTITPLKLGELWAIPIMIRIALVENLRRIAFRVGSARHQRDSATYWADRMINVAEKEPNKLILEIADMARQDPPLTAAFVAELTRRLQGQSSALAMPITWMEQRLKEQGMGIERLVQVEGQQQASDQVSVSNTISSLRTLGAIDWRDFVDDMSVVEKTLREDPLGAYGAMDFATRDRYRHIIEKVSKNTGLDEEDTARRSVDLAGEETDRTEQNDRKRHVGYFLIDKGFVKLAGRTGYKYSLKEKICTVIQRFPKFFYFTAAVFFTLMVSAVAFGYVLMNSPGVFVSVFGGVLIIVCSSSFGFTITNWLATLSVPPRKLGRMDLSGGITPSNRTLVVVPTIINSPSVVKGLIEDLEVRYLANRDDDLFFGLLTDLADAHAETMPEDRGLIEQAVSGIKALNEKYGTEDKDRFFLFHRPRTWNPKERIWMAWERKRGKLFELNRFLRGQGFNDRGYVVSGRSEILKDVRYVITLDTDTHMPLGSARELIATMAHPLNRPVFGANRGIVTEGYGIMQPRVEVSMASAGRSWYVRLFGGEPGIDPYTQTVSDVYQDLFAEGSFIGKGIYDVDAFMLSMNDRFPEDLILSHDLLEGCYARSALVSDIQFFEEYPSSYALEVNRRHRWVRGDWQILSWLLPRVPHNSAGHEKNPISALSRWKILDNVRRSLVPPAMVVLLALMWIKTGETLFWAVFAAGMMVLPGVFISLRDLLKKPRTVSFSMHLKSELEAFLRRLAQTLFSMSNLVFEAFLNIDGAVKALVRVHFTGRGALEWVTSSDMKRRAHTGLIGFYESMWISPVFAAGIGSLLFMRHPGAMSGALPFLILWFFAPMISWRVSRIIPEKKMGLTGEKEIFLRHTARKTWRFFEEFVDVSNNWLPPDNYQEKPVEALARRTSPTNMGMSLLSTLSARDLGYVTGGRFLRIVSNTLESMKKLKRFRGNFYNWYDTVSMEPLEPLYISAVDSGNLAGALMVLRQGILEMKKLTPVPFVLAKGIKDTWEMLRQECAKIKVVSAGMETVLEKLENEISEVEGVFGSPREILARIKELAGDIRREGESEKNDDLKWWAAALECEIGEWLEELNSFFPESGFLTDKVEIYLSTLSLSSLAKMDVRKVMEDMITEVKDIDDRQSVFLESCLEKAALYAADRIEQIERLAVDCDELADMDFDFLYDKSYKLLAIGYNVMERRRDKSCYDLLASEARLASFVGIAMGRLPEDHWFSLGRLFTSSRSGGSALVSWGGSMFEYLMPLLIMPSYENTLLDATYKAVVRKHIRYAARRGLAYWGISESGYNATDARMNYQYRSFGVPGLGFKRGLSDDLVIAPYASIMALMVFPGKAFANLRKMASRGMTGRYGFYEAADHTPARRPFGQTEPACVKSFMAHHQGMSLLSLAYVLLDKPMQKRFLADPVLLSAEPLLHEKLPRSTPSHRRISEPPGILRVSQEGESLFRVFDRADTAEPEVHLLSNGTYNVMITNSGAGYSMWKGLAVTRWEGDITRDNEGSFCYIRDIATGEFWSSGYQPTRKEPEKYEAIFPRGKAEFRRRDNEIETHTEIAVSPEDDMELRRVKLVNTSRETRIVELTSYSEVVLAQGVSDAAHPAFSKLFVETEIVNEKQAILCSRRKRSDGDERPYMYHLAAIHGVSEGDTSYETDRAKFIGRGRDLSDPEAMCRMSCLSGTQGTVLDPVVSIRCRVILEPESSAVVDLVTGMAKTRDAALDFIEKYRDRHLADRVFDLAWTHSQVILRQSNSEESDAQLFGRLAGSIVYPGYSRRASPGIIAANKRGQSGLWGYSISGDLPIVLVQISDLANIDLVRQMFKAHAYWRMKGLAVDLVVWNEDHSGYRQELQDRIMGMATAGLESHFVDKPGGIFIRRSEHMSEEDKVLFQSVARVVISDSRGTLEEQVEPRVRTALLPSRLAVSRNDQYEGERIDVSPTQDLLFFNGIGGFTPDGREYVMKIGETPTPAPWVNVIANPFFGTVISASGSAFTWSDNSSQFRLTPWRNDPVTELGGETFYIRDDENGNFWSPTPMPCGGKTSYVVRHGCGYSVFEHCESGIMSELWVYVSIEGPIKYSVLKIKNLSGRDRKLSAVFYTEPVLGERREKTSMHIVTEIDPKTGALFVRNRYNSEFADHTVFLDASSTEKTFTGDRTEFIGRNGTLGSPAALKRARLSNAVGAGVDPCAAMQTSFILPHGQDKEVVYMLGCGKNTDDARILASRSGGTVRAKEALDRVWEHWNHMLGAVYVSTPEPEVDIMANSWLIYQTVSCRMWAKSAFYQSGGAFGFRDQLQDAMALVHACPHILRDQILKASSRQFREGDVQHWWHEHSGAGVRTRFSDDLLWLPLATARYVMCTGDTGILDEEINFLEGREIGEEEEAYYDKPGISSEKATLYEHCVRAIKKGLTAGRHGMPLMGCGDWNDGMNRVGIGGKGESVWLGFFICRIIDEFTEIALSRGDKVLIETLKKDKDRISASIEKNCWDGKWYLRAFFDDGTPLGSSGNKECCIDALPQSWAVISGAGDKRRAGVAMEQVYKRLVDRSAGIVKLFDPPFDVSEQDPGYIKGYPPGVRENGGQYTHAAVWTAMAFAARGDRERAWELFHMINPLSHSNSGPTASVYKGEPYVMPADVYSHGDHIGRSGWTWYTGSCGWMYRFLLECLLGLSLERGSLVIAPCVPESWRFFVVHYRFRETVYHISFERIGLGGRIAKLDLDGVLLEGNRVPLSDDHAEHHVRVFMGERSEDTEGSLGGDDENN